MSRVLQQDIESKVGKELSNKTLLFVSQSNKFVEMCWHIVVIELFRQRVELVQCVGCLQNQLKRKFTVRNQMFGCLELLVSENLWEWNCFDKVWVSFSDWLIEMMKLFLFWLIWKVYEIVARCEPHFDKDPSTVYTQIRFKLKWTAFFVICVLSLYLYLYFNLNVLNYLMTETYFKIQRQRIDTRNSFKLSSETCWIDENVLEERSSTTSCILSSFSHHFIIFLSLFLFVIDLIRHWFLFCWIQNDIEMKWIEKTFERFDLICLSFTQIHFFETHIQSFETICEMLKHWIVQDLKKFEHSHFIQLIH
jgi:hypothetical protein